MLTNFHTHTDFCDGENTPEEMVRYAIEKGFNAIGFSGHGYTDFDLSYCVKDTIGYISTIKGLKKKYEDKISIFLGIEEDLSGWIESSDYEYIIGSSHYIFKNGKYYPIDCNVEQFKKCLELFHFDVVALAQEYYSGLCDYIQKRTPDIVGHFDLITKFDEIDEMMFLNNEKYFEIAERYTEIAAQNDVIFEVNTGAISRGYRKSPYPHERLLHILKKNNSKLILSSDAHSINGLDTYFEETKQILKQMGFKYLYYPKCTGYEKIHI